MSGENDDDIERELLVEIEAGIADADRSEFATDEECKPSSASGRGSGSSRWTTPTSHKARHRLAAKRGAPWTSVSQGALYARAASC